MFNGLYQLIYDSDVHWEILSPPRVHFPPCTESFISLLWVWLCDWWAAGGIGKRDMSDKGVTGSWWVSGWRSDLQVKLAATQWWQNLWSHDLRVIISLLLKTVCADRKWTSWWTNLKKLFRLHTNLIQHHHTQGRGGLQDEGLSSS